MKPGIGRIVYMVTPDNRLGCWIGHVLCRVARLHYRGCRGRMDHIRDGRVIDAGRWI